MKTKQLYPVTFHYAHTNAFTVNKLIDANDNEPGIIKLFDSESDTHPIRVKFMPNYIIKLNTLRLGDPYKIEVDNYSGIVAVIQDNLPNPIIHDSNRGYCPKNPIVDNDLRSLPPVFTSSMGEYKKGYIDAPSIAPDSFGYIQGDFKGNVTKTLSPLCTNISEKFSLCGRLSEWKVKDSYFCL